jgi:hypothetical protein
MNSLRLIITLCGLLCVQAIWTGLQAAGENAVKVEMEISCVLGSKPTKMRCVLRNKGQIPLQIGPSLNGGDKWLLITNSEGKVTKDHWSNGRGAKLIALAPGAEKVWETDPEKLLNLYGLPGGTYKIIWCYDTFKSNELVFFKRELGSHLFIGH